MASAPRRLSAVCRHGRHLFSARPARHASNTPASTTPRATPPDQPEDVSHAVEKDTAGAHRAGTDPVTKAALSEVVRMRREEGGGSASPVSAEGAFLGAMRLRDAWMSHGAKQVRDESAKEETIASAAAGREHPAVAAYHNGSLGFGFSAGGLMFPYFVGVAAALQDLGILTPGRTHLAGSSAGSLICACVNSGLTPTQTMGACLDLMSRLRAEGTFRKLRPVLHDLLQDHLPQDAHERCRGNTFVNTTRITPWPRAHVVSDFESREELIQSLLTSSHIPVYFDGSLLRRFHSAWACDGAISNFIPQPPTAEYTARICCFPTMNMNYHANIHISPDIFDETWAGVRLNRLVAWALSPCEDEVLQMMFDKGRCDAAAWAQLTGVLDAAAPDPDDWYRYQQMQELIGQAPPDMRGLLGGAAAAAGAGSGLNVR